jgi:hypothetical protein
MGKKAHARPQKFGCGSAALSLSVSQYLQQQTKSPKQSNYFVCVIPCASACPVKPFLIFVYLGWQKKIKQ